MAASCLSLFVLVTVVMAQSVIGLDQAMKDYILGVHNKYRGGEGASNMHSLVWDATLEAEAAQWAGGCRFEHQMKTRGENLAWNSQIDKPETELIDIAMKHFYDEKLRYSYGQRSCGSSSACHYTQLVWAKTRRVGCASRLCTPLANAYNKAWYLVCFYDPKGNWNGEKPFEKGPACSGCSGGTCEANLCVGASDDSSAGKPCEDTNPPAPPGPPTPVCQQPRVHEEQLRQVLRHLWRKTRVSGSKPAVRGMGQERGVCIQPCLHEHQLCQVLWQMLARLPVYYL
ncbi:pathogenesis-related protein PRMS-like [Pomacea canaliculata]|uniref:pathogenesis-related protein PRMS-like n=1 Tax=Pomacea canaliculata TaxID=400727 RepID=UPI000D72CA7C|nr:pathogenesis-related protein PRMS-like [Pomacea canaliculata]